MNIKYTLLKPLSGKFDDYALIIGKWVAPLDKSKTLILKHGVLSQLEYNYIASRKKPVLSGMKRTDNIFYVSMMAIIRRLYLG